MYKREDIIIVPIQTFPLSILAFSPLPPRHQVTSRDNHWWSQSLAYVVKDGVWYTFRGENFYYRNVGANASPPSNKKCLSSEGVIQLPSSPPFFGVYVSRRKMLENQSSHFLKISWKPLRFASWFRTLISCSPNLPRVYIRLCKHGKHFTFLQCNCWFKDGCSLSMWIAFLSQAESWWRRDLKHGSYL